MKKPTAVRATVPFVPMRHIRARFAIATAFAVHLCAGAATAEAPTAMPAAQSTTPLDAQTGSTDGSQNSDNQTHPGSAAPTDSTLPNPAPGTAQAAAPVAIPSNASQLPIAPSDGDANGEDQAAERNEPKAFIASAFAMRLEFGGGVPLGGIIDHEKRAEVSVKYDNGATKTESVTHQEIRFGVNVEFAPIRYKHFKFAIRAGYLYSDVLQDATVGGGEYEQKNWNGQLLGIHTGLIGPVLYLGKRWYGSFQLLTGPASGTLHPIPLGQQIENLVVPTYDFSGWTLRLGPGFGYAWKTLLIGADLLYARTSINFKEVVYTDLGKKTALHTIGVSGNVGLHF